MVFSSHFGDGARAGLLLTTFFFDFFATAIFFFTIYLFDTFYLEVTFFFAVFFAIFFLAAIVKFLRLIETLPKFIYSIFKS